jgi:TetR/AcrR family transcriptional regulator, regulator of cefoperazone and chloramphenicol sensitivity
MEPRPLWDEGTKRRLIMAAGEVFAQHGFRAATIREICKRASASISAVNYHFRDKEGLYEAVFEYSHRWAVEKYPHDLGLGDRATPEERLRAFILSFLLRGLGDGFPAWHGKLLAQETADPQGVLSKVAETVIRPMDEYLEGIVRELFRKEDPLKARDDHSVQLCRMSIVGQCIFQLHARKFMSFAGPGDLKPPEITVIADQIFRFSLGGIQAIAVTGQGQRKGRSSKTGRDKSNSSKPQSKRLILNAMKKRKDADR